MSVAKNFLQSVKDRKSPHSLLFINQMYSILLPFVLLPFADSLESVLRKKKLEIAKHIDVSWQLS